MITKTFDVTRSVVVTVDESKFTPEFLHNFSEHFHSVNGVAGHLEYLAECIAGGFIRRRDDFLEGYGHLDQFGLKFEIEYTSVDERED